MGKNAVIVVSLVKESAEKSNEKIEKEILEELSKHPLPLLPASHFTGETGCPSKQEEGDSRDDTDC